jgi:hypothetical protein
MQADGVENRCGQMISESCDCKLFMLRIQSMPGRVFAFAVQQMAEIVQQGSRNQTAVAAFALDKRCGLQRVFKHRDRFAEVGFAASGLEQLKNFIH